MGEMSNKLMEGVRFGCQIGVGSNPTARPPIFLKGDNDSGRTIF